MDAPRKVELCPRDGAALADERVYGIHVERCASCRGIWLDGHELDELEATKAGAEERRGTIQYSPRPSELTCPACDTVMRTFQYRAHNLLIDECEAGHGFWLDAGEDERVRDIVRERVRGLSRVPGAEAAWHNARRGGRGGLMGGIRRFFGR